MDPRFKSPSAVSLTLISCFVVPAIASRAIRSPRKYLKSSSGNVSKSASTKPPIETADLTAGLRFATLAPTNQSPARLKDPEFSAKEIGVKIEMTEIKKQTKSEKLFYSKMQDVTHNLSSLVLSGNLGRTI